MSMIGNVANTPPPDASPASEAQGPNTQSWQQSAQAASQQQSAQMAGMASQILMMPLITQAMNPDQDDS